MGCSGWADLGELTRGVWEIRIRKLIPKRANQNDGSRGGLRAALARPKGLRGEDEMC